jgi:hypothetical protein
VAALHLAAANHPFDRIRGRAEHRRACAGNGFLGSS